MKRNWIMAGLGLLLVLILTGGFFLAKSALDAIAAQPSSKSSKSSSTSPSPSPTPSPSASPAKSVAPSPSPSRTGPPEGPKPCRYEGTRQSESAVRSALDSAARYEVWRSVKITLPVDLVKAVAQHESGWQSNAVSCDGAYGVMQVLPGTADHMNSRFVETIGGWQDYKTLTDNTRLGSAYLQWLVKKLGDDHFGGNYALRVCANSTDRCLLNAVISAYHAGEDTTSKALAAGQGYPNPDYVANVRWWMEKY